MSRAGLGWAGLGWAGLGWAGAGDNSVVSDSWSWSEKLGHSEFWLVCSRGANTHTGGVCPIWRGGQGVIWLDNQDIIHFLLKCKYLHFFYKCNVHIIPFLRNIQQWSQAAPRRGRTAQEVSWARIIKQYHAPYRPSVSTWFVYQVWSRHNMSICTND